MLPAKETREPYKIWSWHHYSVEAIDPVARTIDLEDSGRHRTGAKGLPLSAFLEAFQSYTPGPNTVTS